MKQITRAVYVAVLEDAKHKILENYRHQGKSVIFNTAAFVIDELLSEVDQGNEQEYVL